MVVRDDVCRDIARRGEPYNPFKPPAATQAQQRPPDQTSESSRANASTSVQQSEATVQGGVVQKQERVIGTFPESVQNRYGGR